MPFDPKTAVLDDIGTQGFSFDPSSAVEDYDPAVIPSDNAPKEVWDRYYRDNSKLMTSSIASRSSAMNRAAIQDNPNLAITGPFAGPVSLLIGSPNSKSKVLAAYDEPRNVPLYSELTSETLANKASTLASFVPTDAGKIVTGAILGPALGFTGSLTGIVQDLITNPTEILSTFIPGTKTAKSIGEAALATKPGQVVAKVANMNVDKYIPGMSVKARSTVIDAAGNVSKVRGAVTPEIDQINQELNTVVRDGVQKAIRPSVVGKGTAKQVDRYFQRAVSAVDDVVRNKSNLELINERGELITGKSPRSLNEALQAIGQTKEELFNTYAPKIKLASDQGEIVDGTLLTRRLLRFASREDVKLSNPELARYATEIAGRWAGKKVSLIDAEKTVKSLNAMLKQKYKQGKISGADISSAQIDAMVADFLRTNIARKAGVGDLKRRYGALSTMEQDVAKRAIVAGRQNRVGLIESVANLETGADIAGGVALASITGNPAFLGIAVRGLGAKATSAVIKSMNSPDANISRMFNTAEKLISRKLPKNVNFEAVDRVMQGRRGFSDADVLTEMQGLPDPGNPDLIESLIGSRKLLTNKSAEGMGRAGYSETYPMRRQRLITDPSSGDTIKTPFDELGFNIRRHDDKIKKFESIGRKDIADMIRSDKQNMIRIHDREKILSTGDKRLSADDKVIANELMNWFGGESTAGHLIKSSDPTEPWKVVGRTRSNRPEFFQNIGISMDRAQVAIDKAFTGKPMTYSEVRDVKLIVDAAKEYHPDFIRMVMNKRNTELGR